MIGERGERMGMGMGTGALNVGGVMMCILGVCSRMESANAFTSPKVEVVNRRRVVPYFQRRR